MIKCNNKTAWLVRFAIVPLLLSIAPLAGFAGDDGPVLKQVQGIVLVDHGDGFAISGSGTQLQRGDRIITAEGASALMVIEKSGCVLRLLENKLVTIGTLDTCAQITAAARRIGPRYAAAIGVFKPTPKPDDTGEAMPSDETPEQEVPAKAEPPLQPAEQAPQEVSEAGTSPPSGSGRGERIVDSLKAVPTPVLWLGGGLALATVALHSGSSSTPAAVLSPQ